ncbi:MAG: shikimate kinase, partial [Bdellovibrionales bacterium]
EIEQASGQSVAEIFAREGEARYRQMEQEWLNRLVARAKPWQATWIAIGAGFQGEMPDGVEVLWLRRPSDSTGRIFLNRPVLNPALSPLQEYFVRHREREPRYGQWASHEYILSEGFLKPSAWEAQALGFAQQLPATGGMVTLTQDYFRTPRPETQIARLLKLGPDRLELREDLLGAEQLKQAQESVPKNKTLYSLRASTVRPATPPEVLVDWALELPGAPTFEPSILSRHKRQANLARTLADWPGQSGAILKLAVEIENFEELQQGHLWWLQDPTRRSFLPHSKDGRWQWYRQLFGGQMPLAFWREGSGSASDQPTLFEWLRVPKKWNQFAAILGWPVSHSHTPAEQQDFFMEHKMPVVAVGVPPEQWSQDTLRILREMGLSAAAVTAPLKEETLKLCAHLSPQAADVKAVNTLRHHRGKWHGHNTDLDGFRQLLESLPAGEVAVWGGGGTRAMMKSVLPEAQFCSIRTGDVQGKNLKASDLAPKTVIWAVGRSRFFEQEHWPPNTWRPTVVMDLNYSKDSPGLEYALKCKANYLDGGDMFRAQAHAQREFWQGSDTK